MYKLPQVHKVATDSQIKLLEGLITKKITAAKTYKPISVNLWQPSLNNQSLNIYKTLCIHPSF